MDTKGVVEFSSAHERDPHGYGAASVVVSMRRRIS